MTALQFPYREIDIRGKSTPTQKAHCSAAPGGIAVLLWVAVRVYNQIKNAEQYNGLETTCYPCSPTGMDTCILSVCLLINRHP